MGADLLETCPDCQGEGAVQRPEWKEWREEYGGDRYRLRQKAQSGKNLTHKERQRLTEAERAMPNTDEEAVCATCFGEGEIPTERGREVLELCAKWLEVDQPDARWKGKVVRK